MSDERFTPIDVPAWIASIPLVALVVMLTMNLWCFEDATGGPNQIALLVGAAMSGLLAKRFGVTSKAAIEGITTSIQSALSAILILLVIGALSATWMISGVVPTMIYYGLAVLDPSNFLVASVMICAVVSVATGSSWATIATVGIAVLGIGNVLNVSAALTAGAIISGAYFGDKISPLSDTTNLAAAMAGANLFTHIRHMLWTTIPSITIAMILFAMLSPSSDGTEFYVTQADAIVTGLEDHFVLSVWLLLVPLSVFAMVLMKFDSLASLIVGTLLGGVFAVIFQPDLVQEVGGGVGNYFVGIYRALMTTMGQGFSLSTGVPALDRLIQPSGMAGMLNTVWLILCAMCFGGVMEASGMLAALTRPLITSVKSDSALVTSTAATCCFFNITASDQYLAIVVPGRMFRDAFGRRQMAPEMLSRTLEDAGTVTSVLIPWNTCGATQAGVLGVAVLTFAPYCFFNWISPLMTILFAWLGQSRESNYGA
jgi:NhaC family Na+:H+ antiporter